MASIPRADWRRTVSNAEAAARAGGRARHNAHRRMMKIQRRRLVAGLLAAGLSRKEMAAALGVALRTIRRDMAALLAAADVHSRCPVCGSGPFVDQIGRPLPWRQPAAFAVLQRAAAWKIGDLENAIRLPLDPFDLGG